MYSRNIYSRNLAIQRRKHGKIYSRNLVTLSMAAEEGDVACFVRKTLKNSEKPGLLTKRILKEKVIEHLRREELTSDEIKEFNSAVDTVCKELVKKGSSIESQKRKHSESSDDPPQVHSSAAEDSSQSERNFKPATKRAKVKKTVGPKSSSGSAAGSCDKDETPLRPKQKQSSAFVPQASSDSDDELTLDSLKQAAKKFKAKSFSSNTSSPENQNKDNSTSDSEIKTETARKRVSPSGIKHGMHDDSAERPSNSDDESVSGTPKKANGKDTHTVKRLSDEASSSLRQSTAKTSYKHGTSSDEGSDHNLNHDSGSETATKSKTMAPKKVKRSNSDDDFQEADHDKKARGGSHDNDPKIVRMKRYIQTAGLRVAYVRLFEKCKSLKAKVQRLQGVLEDAGLKGKPTLDKCKRLRKKLERRKELSELDTQNILNAEGRSRRSARTYSSPSPPRSSPVAPSGNITKRTFARLRGIVNSDDSSSSSD